MKTFLTKKNIAIVLAVLLVVAVVVLCITLRQKSVADTRRRSHFSARRTGTSRS